MATLPAVVTIQDLPTGTTLSGTELLEAVQTVGGVAISIQVPISQIATTSLGGLPAGGGTGQILDKSSGANFAAQWVNLSSLVAAGTSLSVSGSTTVTFGVSNFGISSAQIATNAVGNVQFRQGSPVSIVGVAGNATANVADIVASGGGQILQTNAAGTGVVWGSLSTTLLPGPFQVSSFTANGVVYGNGSSALGVTAAGTAAWPLVANGSALAPSFAVLTVPGGGSGTTALGQFGVVYGNGSSALGATASGTTGWPLVANGPSSAPGFAVLGVVGGGTNTATLTQNGVIFGNGTSAIGITAQGGTATILQANNGAPLFTAAPVIGTSVTVPIVNASGALTFQTNGSTFAGSISTSQQWNIGVNVSPAPGVLLTLNANSAAPAAVSGALLQVAAADSVQPFVLVDSYRGGLGGNKNPFFTLRTALGTGGGFTAVTSGANLGFFGMVGAYAANTFAAANGGNGGIFFGGAASQNWNATSMGAEIRIFTTPNNSSSIAQAVTIQNSGGFSIGTTSDPAIGGIIATGKETLLSGTGLATAGTAALLFSTVSGFGIYIGTGVPSVTAGTGSMFLRNDGATATSRMYINTNGGTTWTSVNTVA